MSGNGKRARRRVSHYQKMWTAEELRLSTRAGISCTHCGKTMGKAVTYLTQKLGQTKFDSASIPMTTEPAQEQVYDYPLKSMASRTRLPLCRWVIQTAEYLFR